MPKFSQISRERLMTCHRDLQLLFATVIEYYDCSIICGHRGEEAQNKAFREHKSKLMFPFSNHNSTPSMAVDVMPYHEVEPHIRWEDTLDVHIFADNVFKIAGELDIKIDWGGNWPKFKDLPHWELRK